MNTPSAFSESVLRALRPSGRGAVGVTDDLLALARDHDLRLEWHDGHCHMRNVRSGEIVEVEMPKSAFRAILARLAAMCNECSPASVSPYRGDAALCLEAGVPATIRVSFTNTPDEQRVDLVRAVKDRQPPIVDAKLAAADGSATPTAPASGS